MKEKGCDSDVTSIPNVTDHEVFSVKLDDVDAIVVPKTAAWAMDPRNPHSDKWIAAMREDLQGKMSKADRSSILSG